MNTQTLLLYVIGALVTGSIVVTLVSYLYLRPYGGLEGLRDYGRLKEEIRKLQYYYDQNFEVTLEMIKNDTPRVPTDPVLLRIETFIRWERWLSTRAKGSRPEEFAATTKLILDKIDGFKKKEGIGNIEVPAFYSHSEKHLATILSNRGGFEASKEELAEMVQLATGQARG